MTKADMNNSTVPAATSAGAFDPLEWIANAEAAGVAPIVIIQPDGTEGLCCRSVAGWRRHLIQDDEFEAVLDAMLLTGRVFRAPLA